MRIQDTFDTCLWYAIHTNPRQEMRAESNLRAWGIETYLPMVKDDQLSQSDPNRPDAVKPLFLRYFFARFRFDTMGFKIRYTRGVKDIVTFGQTPAPIDDEIIDLIRSRQDELGYVMLDDGISLGDEILVKDGIFKGIHGIFERNISNSNRVMILLKAIQFQAHIIVDRGSLKKL
jgi:transcriptional antiterminator RfaH